jgi:hypothetical protein
MMMRDRSHVWKSTKTLRDHASPDWVCSGGEGRRGPPQTFRSSTYIKAKSLAAGRYY